MSSSNDVTGREPCFDLSKSSKTLAAFLPAAERSSTGGDNLTTSVLSTVSSLAGSCFIEMGIASLEGVRALAQKEPAFFSDVAEEEGACIEATVPNVNGVDEGVVAATSGFLASLLVSVLSLLALAGAPNSGLTIDEGRPAVEDDDDLEKALNGSDD